MWPWRLPADEVKVACCQNIAANVHGCRRSELQQVPLVFLWSFGCLCAFVSVGLSVILQGFTTEDLKEGSRTHHVVLG